MRYVVPAFPFTGTGKPLPYDICSVHDTPISSEIGNGFDLYHKLPTRYTDFLFLAKNWEVFYALYNEKLIKTSEMTAGFM
ncbi:MAG: hypothetical protein HFI46_08585 [Lachnospiraceae bacterium]|nr:hypothetical protein [Lachnospiraceae bacterium]